MLTHHRHRLRRRYRRCTIPSQPVPCRANRHDPMQSHVAAMPSPPLAPLVDAVPHRDNPCHPFWHVAWLQIACMDRASVRLGSDRW
jgi:hypothetical protein